MPRGGARSGAGRKPTAAGRRPQNQIRAFPDEWLLIRKFAAQVKHGDRHKCEQFLLDNA